ncbi:MAG: RnfABCDGE type electron transport complex subunit B [Burkholderiales bacterium]
MQPDRDEQVSQVDRLLPQTQCTQCGYHGCKPYAEAIIDQQAPINRCPPGGAAGIALLAALTGRAIVALDSACGVEAPRKIARIVADLCIGCTHCIRACPVDAIAGGPKRLHAIIPELCTGCALCLPPCPVDCIEMVEPPPALAGWTREDGNAARVRLNRRDARLARLASSERTRLAGHGDAARTAEATSIPATTTSVPPPALALSPQTNTERKRAMIEAAVARARAQLRPST